MQLTIQKKVTLDSGTLRKCLNYVRKEWEKAELSLKDFKLKNKGKENSLNFGYNEALYIGKCNALRDITISIHKMTEL